MGVKKPVLSMKPLLFAVSLVGMFLLMLYLTPEVKEPPPMLDLNWIDELQVCPKPDPSRYPKISAEADALYQQAHEADVEIPRRMQPEAIVQLYQQAADKGHLGAMYNLAVSYYEGDGVPQDPTKARYWLEKIATYDIPEGYTAMALIYRKGIGLESDPRKAKDYMVKAAKMGDRDSLYYLGEDILNLQLAYPDMRDQLEAYGVKLLKCAAELGQKEAHFSLALEYAAFDQNHLSYKWLRLGAKAGSGACLRSLSDGYGRREPWLKLNLMEDKKREDCLFKLDSELDKNPDLTFPDLDERCPPNVAQPNVNDDPFPPPRKR